MAYKILSIVLYILGNISQCCSFFSLLSQHTNRQFLNKDGSTKFEDSRVALVALDYLDLDSVAAAVPEIAKAKEWDCKGLFCGVPYYLPLMKYIK